MAINLIASKKYYVDKPIAMTVTNSTPEADVFVLYDFKKDGVSVQRSATAAYAKAKAELSDAGSWTVTGIKADDSEKESTPVVIEVVEVVIPAECPILYVHPLPQRMSAYIWCGWWVMDALQKMTEEGKDWKTATEDDTPYYCHLATLAKMLVDYPQVDVQESRNGYIIHRSALEAGIIY